MTSTSHPIDTAPIRVFLSYARTDAKNVEKLRNYLGFEPRIRVVSPDSLTSGQAWASQLKHAIEDCDVFVVVISPTSVASPNVLYELGAAWGMGKPILPVTTQVYSGLNLPLDLKDLPSVSIGELEDPDALRGIIKQIETIGLSAR